MNKRPEKDGKADEMTVTFTEAANRENIVTGEKASTLMGKIKKWLADLAAAAFMQVVTSYSDLMAGTALDNYLIGAAAAKEGFTELNGKLNKFVTEKVELGSDVILSKNSNFTITFNVTKTGYIPIVIFSWALYNRDDAQYTHVNGIEIGTGINTGYVYIQGRYSNSSATGRIPANAYVGVLYQAQ